MGTIQIVFFACIIGYLLIGYIASKKTKGLDDYYVTGRNANALFVMGTFAATWVSALGILAYPGMSYTGGIGAIVVWGAFPGFVLATLFIVPKLYRSGSWTIFDFLSNRWNDHRLGILAVVFMFFGMFPYLLSQVMGAGTILSGLTGIDYKMMILIACITFSLITLLGGAWSVTVTDTSMILIIIFVAFATLPFTIKLEGGLEAIMAGQYAVAPERFGWYASNSNAKMAISTVLIWTCGMFAAPHQASRILIAKDEKTAMKGVMLAVIFGLCIVWSLHTQAHGLWSVNPGLKNGNEALIYLFMNIPAKAIGALGISALFAAALSTTTTMLLTLAMGVGKDFIKRIKPDTDDKKVLSITKMSVIGWTVIVFIAAWFNAAEMAKWGELGSSMFAVVYFPALIMGLNWKRVTRKAVYASMILGGAVNLGLWIAWRLYNQPLIWGMQPIAYGLVTAILVMVVVSLMDQPTDHEIATYEKLQKKAEVIAPSSVASSQGAATAEAKPDNFKYYCIASVVVGLIWIIGGLVILPS